MDGTNYMDRALELAEQARGQTSPNPMVGAVIVRDGRVVGEGYHHRAGQPHAEVNAIRSAGVQARGAILYVSLEPCCHTGRTPPCTQAIIEAGIRKVVCALEDPNPKVSGGGIRALREAGLEVEVGPGADKASQLNEAYLVYARTGRPFVTLKIAQTIDGRIAAADGRSRWISGEASRRLVHRLRAHSDAVLVGINTVISDDPRLTVRAVAGRNPHRLILDASLRLPPEARLLEDRSGARTIIVTGERPKPSAAADLRARGAEMWSLPLSGPGRIDLDALLDRAGQEGLTSILVEGGAAVFTSFLRARRVHKLHLFLAPKILGAGLSAIADLNITSLDQALCLGKTRVEPMEGDLLVTGYMS